MGSAIVILGREIGNWVLGDEQEHRKTPTCALGGFRGSAWMVEFPRREES